MDAEGLMEIHRRAILCAAGDESALLDAIRDKGTLDHIVEKAEKAQDPLGRALEYMRLIAIWHPFFEGNKRTAYLAAQAALGDRVIDGDPAELDRLVRLIAQGSMDADAMREEFERRLEPCEGDPVDAAIRGQWKLLRRLSL
ncbi:MAG: Fic family protein [Candidatus Methanomethylophilaceae archaeon]|nr:Fic family protein [Candidatus Methanomethylophilaceae archaeon]